MPTTSNRQRVRQRAAAAAASNRPDLTKPLPAEVTTPVIPVPSSGRTDWPEKIHRQHPDWWQVARVELVDDGRTFVLIAECRTEREAFDVAERQLHQVRISRWGDRQRPYFSLRDPRDTRTRPPA